MTDLDPDMAGDRHLELLGRDLRGQAGQHRGDLPGLYRRAEARRRRILAATATASVLVLLAVGLFGALHGGGSPELRTGGIDDSPATTIVAPPLWTVNPSIPISGDDIWGLDVTYDPALWDFSRLIDVAGHRLRGGASYRLDPRLQLYWQGATARADAEAVRVALLGRPGILSAELGRVQGVPGTQPPGTIPGTIPAGT